MGVKLFLQLFDFHGALALRQLAVVKHQLLALNHHVAERVVEHPEFVKYLAFQAVIHISPPHFLHRGLELVNGLQVLFGYAQGQGRNHDDHKYSGQPQKQNAVGHKAALEFHGYQCVQNQGALRKDFLVYVVMLVVDLYNIALLPVHPVFAGRIFFHGVRILPSHCKNQVVIPVCDDHVV